MAPFSDTKPEPEAKGTARRALVDRRWSRCDFSALTCSSNRAFSVFSWCIWFNNVATEADKSCTVQHLDQPFSLEQLKVMRRPLTLSPHGIRSLVQVQKYNLLRYMFEWIAHAAVCHPNEGGMQRASEARTAASLWQSMAALHHFQPQHAQVMDCLTFSLLAVSALGVHVHLVFWVQRGEILNNSNTKAHTQNLAFLPTWGCSFHTKRN